MMEAEQITKEVLEILGYSYNPSISCIEQLKKVRMGFKFAMDSTEVRIYQILGEIIKYIEQGTVKDNNIKKIHELLDELRFQVSWLED